MSWGGSVSAMISSIKNNTNLRGTKIPYTQKRSLYIDQPKRKIKPLRFNDSMSKEEHLHFRRKLERESRNAKRVFYYFVCLLIIGLFVLFI